MGQATITNIPTIGEVIRSWRKFRQLSSTELAKKAKIRIGYLSEIEHDKTANPKSEYLEKLASALEIPLLTILARQIPEENGAEQIASSLQHPVGGQSIQKASKLNSPLSTSHLEILVQRLEVLEEILCNAHGEVREIGALIARIQEG